MLRMASSDQPARMHNHMAGWTNQWIVRWRNLGLTGRFMVTSSIPLILGMSFVGHWVASRISEGVVHSHATAAALYAHSVIESRVQELAVNPALSTEAKSGLDALLRPEGMGKPVVSFRIWKGDRVIYGSDPEDVGMDFPPSSLRARAWAGQVAAEYEEHRVGARPHRLSPAPRARVRVPPRCDDDRVGYDGRILRHRAGWPRERLLTPTRRRETKTKGGSRDTCSSASQNEQDRSWYSRRTRRGR